MAVAGIQTNIVWWGIACLVLSSGVWLHNNRSQFATPRYRLLLHDEAVGTAETERRKRLPPNSKVRLLLIRHGQSEANTKPGTVCGRSNSIPLSEKGRKQAQLLGQRLAKEEFKADKIFVSSAKRAQETAQLVYAEMAEEKEFEVVDEVLEISMGGFTGMDREKAYTTAVMDKIDAETVFFRPPGVSPDDGEPGESQFEVEQRMHRFVEQRVLSLSRENTTTTVAVFGHGLATRCFLRGILGASDTAAVHSGMENTGVTELLYDSRVHNLGGWKVVKTNDHAHLKMRL